MSLLHECLLAAVVLGWAPVAGAQEAPVPLVVIVNRASGVRTLDHDQVVNIFTGRFRNLPTGLVAFPIDIDDRSVERRHFYARLLHKDLAEVDAYWARLVFSGQTSPPLRVPDGRTAVELVAGNRAAIAYVRREDADARVTIVMDLAPERP